MVVPPPDAESGSRRVKSCVVPVAASAALEWAAGRLHDLDLLLRAPLIPEAVFIVDLPNLRAYPACLRAAAHWQRQGAVLLIARTGTPVVAAHIVKFGGILTYHEATTPPKDRYIVPPEGFTRWIQTFVPGSGDNPPVCMP